MKIQSKKLVIGLLFIAFMIIIGASVQIANTPNTDIQGTAIAMEEDTIYEEDITEETEEEIAEESMEMKEAYLVEEVEEEAVEEAKAASVDEPKAAHVEKTKASSATEKNTTATVDTSPITGERYTVKNGDTLFLVAQRANITVNELIAINNLKTDVIHAGQVLQTKRPPQTVNVASVPVNQPVSRGSQRDDDVYWLSRIIHAEAQGEPYEGKVAVGNVILNRVRSGDFPNTIYGVVFDKQHGYTQFSPVIDGTIYNNPHKDSVQAAIDALNGARPVGSALYFLNPRKATNFWIVANRQYMKTIGEHDFYY